MSDVQREVRKPYLIIVSGLPGAGKTYLANKLSRLLGIVHIDYDTVCEPFLMKIKKMNEPIESLESFYRTYRDVCYESILSIVVDNLRNGISVIASAPFSKEVQCPDFFKSFAHQHTLSMISISIHLMPDKNLLLHNMLRRDSYRDVEKIEKWEHFYQKKPSSAVSWDADYQCLPDCSGSISVYDQVVSFLNKIRNLWG